MQRFAMAALAVMAGLSLIGCDKKKSEREAMLRACMNDPRGICQAQLAAHLAQPANARAVVEAAQQDPNLLTPTTGTTAAANPVMPTDPSVSVKLQSAKVSAALKAQSMDPDSPFYEPPQLKRAAAAAAAATPSAPASTPARSTASGPGGLVGDAAR